MKELNIHIIGLGNLGKAFLNGFLNTNSSDFKNYFCYETNIQLAKQIENNYNIEVKTDIDIIDSGILLLCIKPQVVNEFLQSNKSKVREDVLICSPVAGLSIDHISRTLSNKVIRVMPNLLIENNNGFIPYTKNYEGDYLNFIEKNLQKLGTVKEFDENIFPLITALSGSGPAWFYELSSQLVKVGSELGLSEENSELVVKELVKSLPGLISDNESFSALVSKVKSPKGTTEAGLNSLELDSFDKIIYNAINKATNRSIEISKELESE